MRTVIITPPATEPVTLAEAKEQLRIESGFTVDDDYINALISAARDRCESYCNQFFTVQDIAYLYDGPMPTLIELPYPNLTVTALKYTDTDNVQQTIAPADYTVNALDQAILVSVSVSALSYQVEATTSAPAAFDGVNHAIKIIVTDLYELRAESVIGVSIAENPALKSLLYPYRLELGV